MSFKQLSLFFRWLSWRHLVGWWEQSSDKSALSSISSWHALHQYKLQNTWENGFDSVGLPFSPRGPSHVKSFWPRQTWQEAVGPTHDLRHSLWVPTYVDFSYFCTCLKAKYKYQTTTETATNNDNFHEASRQWSLYPAQHIWCFVVMSPSPLNLLRKCCFIILTTSYLVHMGTG